MSKAAMIEWIDWDSMNEFETTQSPEHLSRGYQYFSSCSREKDMS